MIVLDANILIRAVLGRHVRQVLEEYAPRGCRFHAPVHAYSEAERHLPDLLKKFGKAGEVSVELGYLRSLIEPIEVDLYAIFEKEARIRLMGKDEEDWPVLAAAFALACPIWTEDKDFFGVGIPTWTTKHIEIFLKAELESLNSKKSQ